MAGISIVTTTATATPSASLTSANAPSGAASSGGFAALLTGAKDEKASAPVAANDATDRQDNAVTGKDLPRSDDDRDDDKDQPGNTDTGNDVALIWLALAVPVAPPVASPPTVSTSAPATSAAAPSIAATATGSDSASLVLQQATDPLSPSAPLAPVSPSVSADAQQALPPIPEKESTADVDGDSAPTTTDAQLSALSKQAADAKAAVPADPTADPRDPVALLADALRSRLSAAPPAPKTPLVTSGNGAPVVLSPSATQAAAITQSASNDGGKPQAAAKTDITPPAVADPSGVPTDSSATRAPPTPAPPATVPAPATARPADIPGAPVSGAIQPAAQAFAAALKAPLSVTKRTGRDDDASSIGLALPTSAETRIASAEAAPASTIDTRHAKWVDGIIDHIELLRDATNAGDTRIRLVPDALGKIDVAIRKDGDTVNVRFTADQAPTRQLLADAQPRLTEIAAGRGIRLGQTLIDSGDTSTGQQQRQAQQQAADPRQPIANARRVMTDDSEQPDETATHTGWLA